MTLEELKAQREGLLAQLNGVQAFSGEGRSMTNRPLAELVLAINRIDDEIASSTGTGARLFTVQTKRGLA